MRLSLYDKVNAIAAYFFLTGGLILLLACGLLILPVAAVVLQESEFLNRLPGWFLGVGLLGVSGLVVVIAAIHLAIGWGLWQLKPWGRLGAMIVAILSIPFVPIGTLAGGAILYILLQDRTRELFLAPAAEQSTPWT